VKCKTAALSTLKNNITQHLDFSRLTFYFLRNHQAISMKIKFIVFLIFFIFFLYSGVNASPEWIQVAGVVHVQTDFDGTGHYALDQLVSMAKKRGLGVLITADHDLQALEYGLPPFRNIIKKREERKSVIEAGPEKFLARIDRVNKMQKDVLVIPGVQSSPFYYWTGSVSGKDLTAHDYRKELLLVGMRLPEDYRGLPLLHNGFSTRYTKAMLSRSLMFLAGLMLAAYLVLHKGVVKNIGVIISILFVGMLINHHPFQSSRFDPYHGDQGIKPFQELIDYVKERNGHVFWLHPESNYAVNGVRLGPATLITKHYIDDLIASKGYTGFEALYGDNITATDPGKHWDQILSAYCRGDRDRPVWGISGADFHGGGNEKIDTFQTIFLVRHKTEKAILEALSEGRFYAVLKSSTRLSLDRFQVIDNQTGSTAISGQELDLLGYPLVEGRLSASDGSRRMISVLLSRGGEIMESFKGETPLEFHFVDQDQRAGKTFYRLDVSGRGVGKLLSSPIFVSKK